MVYDIKVNVKTKIFESNSLTFSKSVTTPTRTPRVKGEYGRKHTNTLTQTHTDK